jgi:hypothetical protein
MKKNRQQLAGDMEQNEGLHRLIRQALEQDGTFIPTTSTAVARAEAEQENLPIELPASLRTFDDALKLSAEKRVVQCSPLQIPSGTEENLARAAREGGQVSADVEAKMRRDRAAAEGDARAKEHD